MSKFPIKYEAPLFPKSLVPDTKININEFRNNRRLKMDYSIYNTLDENVLRDRLFIVDEDARQPYESFVKALNNIERSLIKKQVRDIYAVATAQAQKLGYVDFSPGSPGETKRDDIAESLKEGDKTVNKQHHNRIWCPKHHRWETKKWATHDTPPTFSRSLKPFEDIRDQINTILLDK